MAFAVAAASLVGAAVARAATTAPPGLPLYQFVNSGTGPLPWNAASLETAINNTKMLGAPHSTSDAAEGVLAYRTANAHVAIYTQPVSGASTFTDLSALGSAPAPAADPMPFIDPAGQVDVAYVDALGELVVLSANDPVGPYWSHAHRMAAWRAEVATNLSDLTGVDFANGLPSVQVFGSSAVIAARTVANTVEVMTLAWSAGGSVPYLSAAPVNLATVTTAGTATSDPLVLATSVPEVVTTSLTGDLELFAATGGAANPWVVTDLSKITTGPKVTGPLATAATASEVYVAAISGNGAVILFSAALGPVIPPPTTTTTTSTTTPTTTTTLPTTPGTGVVGPWGYRNLTTNAPGAPPLSGALFLAATPTEVLVAGQAAAWGDLFALSNTGVAGAWVATDVSVTAGSAARTVGAAVTGFASGASLDLFAAGIASPPPQGVGVYAIPSAKWGQAVTDGWPILSETGGLGTMAPPWVGFTSAGGVAISPDYLMGQSLGNAHKRVTWLSFWTVSGPLKAEVKLPTTYYNHGYAAGAWVATQIDQYRALGVGIKPDWVIFDPEGYPDNHSALDAPSGATNATLATYATYWTAMLAGWQAGVNSVDPSLNAAVYANQSEYRNYQLSASPLPVFEAVAFGNGGPVPVAGASGSNVRGFIAFSALCSPTSTLQSEEATLVNPPWAGQFNTLQFNAGVYCAPAPA
ncbi:MAG: hypothetical protein ACHQFZ_04980 [Acidimicrobiales bacterium]